MLQLTLQQSSSSQLKVAGCGEVVYTTELLPLPTEAAVPPISVHELPLSVERYVSLYTPPPHARMLLLATATVLLEPDEVVYVMELAGKAQPWRMRGFHGGDGCWLNRAALATVAMERSETRSRETRILKKSVESLKERRMSTKVAVCGRGVG